MSYVRGLWYYKQKIQTKIRCDVLLCIGYVNLGGEMANITAMAGHTVRVRCDVTGFPLPRYRWLLNGQQLLLTDGSRRYEARTTVWGSLLVYTLT